MFQLAPVRLYHHWPTQRKYDRREDRFDMPIHQAIEWEAESFIMYQSSMQRTVAFVHAAMKIPPNLATSLGVHVIIWTL